jgi:hypothetical protein
MSSTKIYSLFENQLYLALKQYTNDGINGNFVLLFEYEIYQMYKELGNLDWHSSAPYYNGIGGAFLIAARRAMASNISQPPLIVAQHTELNRLGLHSYYTIN